MLIDLNKNLDIPFTEIINSMVKKQVNKQQSKEKPTYTLNNFSSACISVNSSNKSLKYPTSLITNIFGPNETRHRLKMKNTELHVEVNSNFYYETSKEKQNAFNLFIKNFVCSVIKLDEYPRCFLTVVVNIIDSSNELELKSFTINSVMCALALSAVDMKLFGLSTVIDSNLFVLDVNNLDSVIFIEGEMDVDTYKEVLEKAKESVNKEYKYMKSVLMGLRYA